MVREKKTERLDELLSQLEAAFDGESEALKVFVVRVLSGFPDSPGALRVVKQAAHDEEAIRVRREAVRTLGRWWTLSEKDAGADARQWAREMLLIIGRDTWRGYGVREEVAEAYAPHLWNDDEARRVALGWLEAAPAVEIRGSACLLRALRASMGKEEVRKAVMSLLWSDQRDAREEAYEALWEVRDEYPEVRFSLDAVPGWLRPGTEKGSIGQEQRGEGENDARD